MKIKNQSPFFHFWNEREKKKLWKKCGNATKKIWEIIKIEFGRKKIFLLLNMHWHLGQIFSVFYFISDFSGRSSIGLGYVCFIALQARQSTWSLIQSLIGFGKIVNKFLQIKTWRGLMIEKWMRHFSSDLNIRHKKCHHGKVSHKSKINRICFPVAINKHKCSNFNVLFVYLILFNLNSIIRIQALNNNKKFSFSSNISNNSDTTQYFNDSMAAQLFPWK